MMRDPSVPTAADPSTVTVRIADETVDADSTDEVCAYLIDGYDDTDDEDDRLTLRAAYAAHVQHHIQQIVLVASGYRDELTAEEHRYVTRPVDGPPPTPKTWETQIPLVIVTTDYQPWTDHPTPVTPEPVDRYLWVIDPTTPDRLIVTLDDIGYLHLEQSGIPGHT